MPVTKEKGESKLSSINATSGNKSSHNKKDALVRPDDKIYRAKLQEISNAISEVKEKLVALNRQIDASSVGKEEFKRKQAEIRRRLDELQEKDANLEKRKSQLFQLIDNKQKEGKEIRANAQMLKKSLGFSSEIDIDKKIEEIERRMMTSTISLKEEKKLIAQIAEMKKQKPLVGKYANLESSANLIEDHSVAPLREQVESLRDEIAKIRSARKEEAEKFRKLMYKRNEETAAIRELFDQRDVLNKELTTHFENKRALQDAFNSEMDKYNAYINRITAMKNERIREEEKKKAVEAEKMNIVRRLETVEEVPLENEVLLLQQTIQYVQKLMADKSLTKNNNQISNNNANNLHNGSESTEGRVLRPKNEREEEYYFAPKEKKEGKGGKKGGGGKHKEKSKAIKLDLGTLAIFEQIQVDPPVVLDDLETCMNKLNEKLKAYKEEQMKKYDECKQLRKDLEAKLEALNLKATAKETKKNGKGDENVVNDEVQGETTKDT